MMVAARERLNRHLARRGIASRRGADSLIAEGRVTVNGSVAAVGSTVDAAEDRVAVDGRRVGARPRDRTVLLNKPPGVVTTRHDPQGRPTVMGLVQPVPGLVPVGRLDAESRGLLLLSNEGDLVHRAAHPRYGLRRVYRVQVTPPASGAQVRSLLEGVELDDGTARALEARRVGHGIEIVMGEGRRREVRRMCAAVGLDVIDLLRIAYGPIRLGDLPEGASRPLLPEELEALRRSLGLG